MAWPCFAPAPAQASVQSARGRARVSLRTALSVVAHLASVKAIHPGIWPWLVHLLVLRPGVLRQHGAALVKGMCWQGNAWQPQSAWKSRPACQLRTLKQSCEQKTLKCLGRLMVRHFGHCSCAGFPQLQQSVKSGLTGWHMKITRYDVKHAWCRLDQMSWAPPRRRLAPLLR